MTRVILQAYRSLEERSWQRRRRRSPSAYRLNSIAPSKKPGAPRDSAAAPLTTRVRKIPSEVPLSRDDGVPKTCVVSLDTITTIPRRALTVRLTALSPIKLAAVDRAVRFALGLGEPAAR